ncbi:MAG: response regulator [Armatimonadetes bacterium]|nr:response regulator [Armatimonadota bacterium]
MCWALERTLNQEGYETVPVTGWLEGLLIIRGERIDLVLLDISIPDMDALTVLERIQKAKPDLPVLIMTGHKNVSVAVEAVQRGARGYLTKPFSINNLKTVVKKVLSSDYYPLSREAIYR